MNAPAANALTYKPKTKPRRHQGVSLRKSLHELIWAHFHEQRCGKTWIVINKSAYHYEVFAKQAAWSPYQNGVMGGPLPMAVSEATRTIKAGINAMLVVAMPADVPGVWVEEQIPQHLPDRIPRLCFQWSASKFKTKKFEALLASALTFQGLVIITINAEATITPNFKAWAPKFLRQRRVHIIYDESTLSIQTAGVERHKIAVAMRKIQDEEARKIGQHTGMRTIMDGTPYGQSPLAWYPQFDFLDPHIIGHTSAYTYRNHFCVLEKQTATRFDAKSQSYVKYEYEAIKEFRNLGELHDRIARFSDRVRRADISDAPPKTYHKLKFDLTPEQRRVYDSIQEEHEALLASGQRVTYRHVLVRRLRLQQVTSNILPTDPTLHPCPACTIDSLQESAELQNTPLIGTGENCELCEGLGFIPVKGPSVRIDAKKNPRLEALADTMLLNFRPSIVWCKFHSDTDDVIALARHHKIKVCQYDGRTSKADKALYRAGYQKGDFDLMIGNQVSAGRGTRWDRAEEMYYYSNQQSLTGREQSEDRAEDVDRKISTNITDVIANNSIDETIVDDLRTRRTVSEIVMRENRGNWI